MKNQEVWIDVIDYGGYYQISNKGIVKSLRFNKERVLNSRLIGARSNNKYLDIEFVVNYNKKHFKVHRLVAIHFVPNPFNLPEVNHKDGDKLNNNDWNLEWVSTMENACHRSKSLKSTSQYIGVCWDKVNNKWMATIRYDNKQKFLGYFNTELEAYQARCNFEKENKVINKYLTTERSK